MAHASDYSCDDDDGPRIDKRCNRIGCAVRHFYKEAGQHHGGNGEWQDVLAREQNQCQSFAKNGAAQERGAAL